jgi:L,D-transpeptidase-like protein
MSGGRLRWPAGAALIVLVAITSLTGCSGSPEPIAPPTTPPPEPQPALPLALPASPSPAFVVPNPVRLPATETVALWAPVLRNVQARAKPDLGAPFVGRLSRRTPERTDNIVLVLERAKRAGAVWVRVRLPASNPDATGWIPRSALAGYGIVWTRLVVDVERATATLYRNGRRIFRARVGVGKPQWPTPKGEFYIRNKLTKYRSAFYGPLAFGTSARSAVLTDWPNGGFVGIHGTNRPDLLPGEVSHGCIRMRNTDIVRLGRLMPIGTPLTIR